MSYKMSKSALKELIQEDVNFILKHCPATLERSHVINVLNDYINKAYPKNNALDGLKKSENKMKIKAKFVCVKVEDQPTSENQNITLTAVISGSEENKSFSKYTPSGNLNMTVSYDTPASSFFEEGVEYYLTLEVAAIPVN